MLTDCTAIVQAGQSLNTEHGDEIGQVPPTADPSINKQPIVAYLHRSHAALSSKVCFWCQQHQQHYHTLVLEQGWNQIQFNLSDFTRRAYGTNYIETLRVQIHANCRIRRIYFSDRLYSEEELPPEFKLFLPITKQEGQGGQQPLAAT